MIFTRVWREKQKADAIFLLPPIPKKDSAFYAKTQRTNEVLLYFSISGSNTGRTIQNPSPLPPQNKHKNMNAIWVFLNFKVSSPKDFLNISSKFDIFYLHFLPYLFKGEMHSLTWQCEDAHSLTSVKWICGQQILSHHTAILSFENGTYSRKMNSSNKLSHLGQPPMEIPDEKRSLSLNWESPIRN